MRYNTSSNHLIAHGTITVPWICEYAKDGCKHLAADLLVAAIETEDVKFLTTKRAELFAEALGTNINIILERLGQ